MKLSPTIEVKNLYTESELDSMVKIITEHGIVEIDDGSTYPDSGRNGKFAGQLVARWTDIDFDQLPDLQQLLLPKLTQSLGGAPIIQDVHILESHNPYMVHNDTTSVRGLNHLVKDHLKHLELEYTIIIPIKNYDSCTIVFNEAFENTNSFSEFKKNYNKDLAVSIDKQLILERLTHLHPADFKYLTLKSIHQWDQGSMFAIDCRYFHSSDNFPKRGIPSKTAIIIRTLRSKD
jgi:hypothetical protein